MAEIVLQHLGKVYPDGTRALRDLNIPVEDGEFIVLVGPSGCGKTTALRMVAGLETITEGEVRIADRRVNNVPPRDRDIAMVFQSYALYPHLSVRDNIGFGLALRKVAKDERHRRVEQAAATLGLAEYLDRKPRNLSGGQRQRVAMGRAIVRQPAAFLMDEPLSNLDAKLRVQMRAEIGRLQRELEVTTLYVTHDQVEAMTLGHRVAVLRDGLLQQIAPPQDLYDRPTNLFVAGFIGSPAMNFLPADVRVDQGRWTLVLGEDTLTVPPEVLDAHPALRRFDGRRVVVGMRPENLEDARVEGRGERDTLSGVAELVEPLGSDLMVYLSVDLPSADLPEGATAGADREDDDAAPELTGEQSSLVARFSPTSKVALGDRVRVAVNTARLHFFDPETGTSVIDA